MAVIREIIKNEKGEDWLMKTYSDYETETQIGNVKSDQTGVVYGEALDPIEYAEERTYTEVIIDKPKEQDKDKN